MKLLKRLFKSIGIWFLVLITIILIVLIPRDVQTNIPEPTEEGEITIPENLQYQYEFSFQEFRKNILLLSYNLWTEQNLGSTRFGDSANNHITRFFPRSVKLLIIAFIISLPLGVIKGIIDYRLMNKRTAPLGNGTTWFFQSLPDFFVIIGVQWLIILLMRMGFPSVPIYGYGEWYNVFFPSVLLSLYPTFYIARITSSALSAQENQHYTQTAYAKGLTRSVVVYKHMLSNSWGTILTHLPTITLYMLSNLLVIEYLTFYNGAAYRLYQALGFQTTITDGYNPETFEPFVVVGFLTCFMLIILITQLISQFARYFLDPRIKEDVS